MADIELVIKIPEEAYKWIRNEVYDYSYLRQIILGICKGTPLPKGHGRLIDADELYDSLVFPTEQFGKSFKELMDDAPTIIEADKE